MTTGATPPALKACPWCGGKANLESADARWTVGCEEITEEGAVLCYGYQSLTTFATQREAIAAWNRRASGTEAALRETLEKIKHSIVHAVGTGKPKAVKAFEEIWTLADAALSPHAKEESAALASPPRDGWRTMDSAPTGQEVLLFDPKWGVCEGLRFDGGTWGLATFNGSIKQAHPTCWMPQPSPPRDGE